jgi:hypothetical protein
MHGGNFTRCASQLLASVAQVEYVVAFLAVARAHGIAAPLNPSYTREENEFYLQDSRAMLLLVPSGASAAAKEAAGRLGVPVATLSLDLHSSSGAACSSPVIIVACLYVHVLQTHACMAHAPPSCRRLCCAHERLVEQA